jgi:hypothetical protein
MAVIKCTLGKGGKLKVSKVIRFEPGDRIELDRSVDIKWPPDGGGHYHPYLTKCLQVWQPFEGTSSSTGNVIPTPCPGR